MKIQKKTILVFLLLSILFISIFSNTILTEGLLGSFQFYYELSVFIVFILFGFGYINIGKGYFISVTLFLLIVMFFLSRNSNYSYDLRYLILDFVKFSIFYFLIGGLRKNIFSTSHTIFFLISFLIVLSNLFLLENSKFYSDDGRFLGVMFNINQTAYLIGFSLIFIHYYTLKSARFYFTSIFIDTLLLLLSVLFLYFTGSRSFIPVLVFFIVTIFRLKFKSLFIFLYFSFFFVYFSPMFNFMNSGRLFDLDDPSILTRSALQADFVEESLKSIFKPHGPNSATLYVKSVTKNDDFHLHNDFLAYFFDYGFIFLAYIFIIIKMIARIIPKFNLEIMIVILFYFSSMLHGYSFSFFISIPLMFVWG